MPLATFLFVLKQLRSLGPDQRSLTCILRLSLWNANVFYFQIFVGLNPMIRFCHHLWMERSDYGQSVALAVYVLYKIQINHPSELVDSNLLITIWLLYPFKVNSIKHFFLYLKLEKTESLKTVDAIGNRPIH